MTKRLLIVLLGLFIATVASAAIYQTTDGRNLIGDPVGYSDRGLVMKLADGSYAPAVPWSQLTQDTLKDLRKNPKAANYVEQYIQLSDAERQKMSGLKLVPVPRIDRPTGHTGVMGMMFSSGVGWFLVLLIYLGNLFSAYEVALYRAYSPQAVCGLAAVLPWIGPALLLAIPREMLIGAIGGRQPVAAVEPAPEELQELSEGGLPPAGVEPTVLPPGESFEDVAPPPEVVPALLPETITYSRGVVTFNRRFFESKLNMFTKVVPPDEAKDLVVVFKTSRGNLSTKYISKLEPTELYIHVEKGNASEDVKIPYLEIYEVQVKHKDVA